MISHLCLGNSGSLLLHFDGESKGPTRVEYSVEVTADSLYEAVARGSAALRDADWAGDIGHGQTTITVVVKQTEVEHKVGMLDFDAWLRSNGRSPAEMALKTRLRRLLNK
jgi:hypothetical protein